jgi:hypothetical protein
MMKMIDVMKRLAELDAQNPSIVKENADLAECGMMPEMGMGMGAMEKPSTPATINMTAGSADELGNLLKDIVSLAGMNKVEPEQLGVEPAPMTMAPEPAIAIGGGSPADDMRSVIDKLHPDMDDAEGGEEGGDDVSQSHGDLDNDGDHDMDDHDKEKKEPVDEYDNDPADSQPKQPFDANQFSNNENKPGQGDRMDGDRPKAYADMNEAAADLFAQYKQFVNEN